MTITKQQILDVLPLLPEDATNPLSGKTCVYTGADGSHCIAGEVLTRLGYEERLPKWGEHHNGKGLGPLIRDKILNIQFEEDAAVFLVTLQGFADGMRSVPSDDGHALVYRPWGEAINFALARDRERA